MISARCATMGGISTLRHTLPALKRALRRPDFGRWAGNAIVRGFALFLAGGDLMTSAALGVPIDSELLPRMILALPDLFQSLEQI